MAIARRSVACSLKPPCIQMGKSFTHVDDTERRLVKKMVAAGIPWSQVQKVTGRSSDTIHSILKTRPRLCMKGAPAKLSVCDVAKTLRVAETMIKKANGQEEVTLPMILRKAGHYVSETTARKYLEQNKVAFFKLKEKPLLESGDYDARKKWVDSHKGRTPTAWITRPHATIGNKSLQMVRCRKSREFVAQRSIRGASQKKGDFAKEVAGETQGGSEHGKISGRPGYRSSDQGQDSHVALCRR